MHVLDEIQMASDGLCMLILHITCVNSTLCQVSCSGEDSHRDFKEEGDWCWDKYNNYIDFLCSLSSNTY